VCVFFFFLFFYVLGGFLWVGREFVEFMDLE
jgi:hypothetical protein